MMTFQHLQRLIAKASRLSRILLVYIVLTQLGNIQGQIMPSVPPLINYQGRLTDATGQAAPPGNYTIDFRIWDKQASGLDQRLIWGREYLVTVINGGTFNVVLGGAGGVDIVGARTNDISAAFDGSERFLGLTLVANPSGPVSNPKEIFPRQAFLSSPYSLRSAESSFARDLAQELREALCPTGTVIAWMGINHDPPPGWEFCRGQLVGRNDPKYSALFGVIGTSNGAGPDNTTFRLPDLRGMFLRGVNLDRNDGYSDPDSLSRTNAVAGGNSGNQVGSVQLDVFAKHLHPAGSAHPGPEGRGGGSGAFLASQIDPSTGYAGGNETRPKNVYVHYLIKL